MYIIYLFWQVFFEKKSEVFCVFRQPLLDFNALEVIVFLFYAKLYTLMKEFDINKWLLTVVTKKQKNGYLCSSNRRFTPEASSDKITHSLVSFY